MDIFQATALENVHLNLHKESLADVTRHQGD
jgi:hypothetical protein